MTFRKNSNTRETAETEDNKQNECMYQRC